jgi:3-deoxy-D-manno-octulosonic-acid transferase
VSLALTAYRAAAWALEPLAPLLLRQRAGRGKEDPARLHERLGEPTAAVPNKPVVWLHGVSVGESLSLLPLVDLLAAERPDLAVLVTTGTVTSAELMRARLPKGVIHQYAPVDGPRAVARFLDHWSPVLGVFVESELWPNLLLAAEAHGVKLALVSARITDRTTQGWARAPGMARRLLGAFDLILAQDVRSGVNLENLGARPDGYANLKLIGEPLPHDPAEFARLSAVAGDRPIVVGASTHFGEDELFASAAEMVAPEASPLLILVPRHPERGPDIAASLRPYRRMALRSAGEPLTPDVQVYVADTLGELGLFLRLADVVLMGGSFTGGVGGHNPLEPARLGKPVLYGHDTANWIDIYRDLTWADAAQCCETEGELIAGLAALLRDPELAKQRGQAALRAAKKADAGAGPVLDRLAPLLPEPRR